jgi:hypothetical protein
MIHRISSSTWKPLVFYTLISLLITGPLLGRGYILTLDMVFTPTLHLPEQVGSSYLFHALLHYLNLALPADILQKILLVGIFVVAGFGSHRLIGYLLQPTNWHLRLGQMIGGTFYVINPFTYERLMAGQYAVLLGYALLPWFLQTLLRLLRQPSWPATVRLALLVTVIGIVSIHSLGPVALLALACLVGAFFRYDKKRWQLYCTHLGAAALLFVVLSSYWLLPVISGNSAASQQIASFGEGDRSAFATSGESFVEKTLNIVQLRGFWAERHELFTLPWDRLGATWYLLAVLIIGAVVTGLSWYWRRGRQGTAALLGVIIAIGTLFASGAITGAFDAGLLAGYREPHKFAMLVALAYSLGLAAGVGALISFWSEQFPARSAIVPATAVLFALPFIWTATMLWGGNGQLAPRHYPAGWFAVNSYLNKQAGKSQAIFLPWHLYFHTDFAGRVIANPAPNFFDKPVIVSHDPGLPGATGNPTATSRQVGDLLARKPPDLAAELKRLDVDYVIFAKENDYRDYLPTINQSDFQPVVQTATINLYHIRIGGER